MEIKINLTLIPEPKDKIYHPPGDLINVKEELKKFKLTERKKK